MRVYLEYRGNFCPAIGNTGITSVPYQQLFFFFFPRFNRQGFLGIRTVVARVPAWKEGLETLIETKGFSSDQFWCRFGAAMLLISVFTARSCFQRSYESRLASQRKGRHGRCHNGDASSMRKYFCRLRKDTLRCLCSWIDSGEIPVPVESCVRMRST